MEKIVKYIRDHNEKILDVIVCFGLYKIEPAFGIAYTTVLLTGIFSQKILRKISINKIKK